MRARHGSQSRGDTELEPIDVAFADLVGRLAPGEVRDTLHATALLLSHERQGGHACVRLSEWAGRRRIDHAENERYPEVDAWLAALRTSGLAAGGEGHTPFVLDADGRCYLRRYYQAERRVARWISQAVAATSGATTDQSETSNGGRNDDAQARALHLVSTRRLIVLSGGPGSGKTTTVARLLAELGRRDPSCRVALCAPTGKAAQRLNESIRQHGASLAGDAAAREWITKLEAKTLHRLLGFGGAGRGPRHDAAHPLAVDVVIVDEASMVDLPLMDALLAAIPVRAKLVLVGDKDQLASVEAGFVFGDLCEAARAAAASRLAESTIELTGNWRFASHPGIEALSSAVRAGDAAAAETVLADVKFDDVVRDELPADAASLVRSLAADIERMAAAATPDQALAALSELRLLSATHRGAFGVDALNDAVESMLRASSAIGSRGSGPFYSGRPVLVTVNDYGLGLFNGDIGVCFPDTDGELRVWFAAKDEGLRSFAPSRLPVHATAWAMTVHKSQGSEFDRVMLVLPDLESPLLTRELVYTAITRARSSVRIFASAPTLAAAIAARAVRASGLRDALAEQ